jgi:nicotinate-nucleotide adenylyltransferase
MDDPTSKNRIGILGGTFNPVHMGHLILAQDALEQFELSKVVFMPCACPPHKSVRDLIPAEHRAAMLEAAIEGDLRFQVSRDEIERDGISYTIDTARAMKLQYPESEIVFVIGSDSLMELHLWKEINALLEVCRFVTLTRPGADYEALMKADLRLSPEWSDRLREHVRVGHTLSISSTDIRYRVAEGMSIRYLVHPAVEMYITEHSLYRR